MPNYDNQVQRPSKFLHTDNSAIDQPSDSYRFALNAVNETLQGDDNFITNESSNSVADSISGDYVELGSIYIGDNNVLIFSVNGSNSEIGIFSGNKVYTPLVNSQVLGFDINHKIDSTFRIRKSNQRYVYWVDGLNNARSLSIDNLYTHYSNALKTWISNGNPVSTFVGEKFDKSSFELIASYDLLPTFESIEILPYGNLKSGSYNFAIAYVDDDNNTTGWITVSNPVNIYVDQNSSAYHTIRGSRNTQNQIQSFPTVNKSISVIVNNLDQSFPYYKVAVIQAVDGTGKPTKALTLPDISTKINNFVYSGNDDELIETPLTDITIEGVSVYAPEHIEQLENRLLLASSKGSKYNWCDFQPYASAITSDLTTENVILNNIESLGNVKNINSTFSLRGFMPGEVYSFGIIFLMKDNSYSPVFHIPGRPVTGVTNNMVPYELESTYYNDIHNCDGISNYWGVDGYGNSLKTAKVRHHRFPLRKDSGHPLITSSNTTVTIRKYKLSYQIYLKTGQTYPTDTNGDPISIDFNIHFKLLGSSVIENYNGVMIESNLNTDITFYDSFTDIDHVTYPDYAEFDPTSDLIANYGSVFDVYITHDYYDVDTIENSTTSELYGISFSNIEKPHDDVVGYFIVRNERLDSDKIVVDNAVLGATITGNNYTAFSHINTVYTADHYGQDTGWFLSPEHQFFGKKPQFSEMSVEGYYTVSFDAVPDTQDPMKDPVTGNTIPGASKYQGITIRDVVAGTSFNPDVDKKKYKDNDGFALVIGYRASDYDYSANTEPLANLEVDNLEYLSAASNKLVDGTNLYNVSCDNKIGFSKFLSGFDPSSLFTGPGTTHEVQFGEGTNKTNGIVPDVRRLAYVSLLNNNTTAYQNFIVRDYYKEHNNPVLFGSVSTIDNHRIFNGDAQISALNFTSSIYFKMDFSERAKKKSIWKIVVGSILVVVGAILSIVYGAGAPLVVLGVGLLSVAAVSIGVSQVMSGFKLEQMKSMVDVDYDKGLLQCVADYEVTGQMNSMPGGGNVDNANIGDDNIEWFVGRANNLYIESSVPFGLRSGVTGYITDFVNAPNQFDREEFETYLTEKFTTIDTNQGDGRLYRGYPVSEFYDMNSDYLRFNKEKSYIHLPETFDCCTLDSSSYPLRISYSQQSFQEEKTDNYRNFLAQNYRDIEGENGVITDLYKIGNSLFIHTKESLFQLPQNVQERANTDLISFIGTGDFFAISPRRISNGDIGSLGSRDKWATCKTENGVLIISQVDKAIYLHNEGISNISNAGMSKWFRNNVEITINKQIYQKTQVQLNLGYTDMVHEIGYSSVYDPSLNRLIITKRDYNILPNYLANFRISNNGIDEPLNVLYYDTSTKSFWINSIRASIKVKDLISLDNELYFENKSFTISYSLKNKAWVSFHSYIPHFYFRNQDTFFSKKLNDGNVYEHNIRGNYLNFYNNDYPHIIEMVSNKNPLINKTWEDIQLKTVAKKYDSSTDQYYEDRNTTFNKGIFYNQNQCSGEQTLVKKEQNDDMMFAAISNNSQEVIIGRRENLWSLNQFRNYVDNITIPFFTSNWINTKSNYFIDKVINDAAINFNKDWNETELLRSEYLITRFIFDNFDDVKLTTDFSIETSKASE